MLLCGVISHGGFGSYHHEDLSSRSTPCPGHERSSRAKSNGQIPHLKLLQARVTREQITAGVPARTCLPLTLRLVGNILRVWSLPPRGQPPHDLTMLRAAVSVCIFDFFCVGEIIVPPIDSRVHLAWGICLKAWVGQVHQGISRVILYGC